MRSGSSSRTRTRTARALWRRIHLGLALAVGGVFAFLGLTGSFLVFYKEIDAFLNPDLFVRQDPAAHELPIADLVTAVESAIGPVRRVDVAAGSGEVHRMQVVRMNATTDTLEVIVDPGSGSILGTRPWRGHLAAIVYDLHYSLLAGRAGRDLVGYASLALLLSVGSGLYLWWPRNGRFAKALRVKRRAPWSRRFYDIHKSLGLAAALLLCVSAFSGVSMQFPEAIRTLAGALFPTAVSADHAYGQSAMAPGTIDLNEVIARARSLVPDARPQRILFPDGETNAYRVYLRRPGEMYRSIVDVAAANGAITYARLAENYSAVERILAWQFPLHNGTAFGLAGRIVVFVLGFMPATLYITGLMLWWKKRKVRSQRE